MSIEENKALVARFVSEAEQGGNLALIDELLTPDFVDHTPLPGVPPTRDGIKVLFAGLQSAFPDLSITIQEQVAEGDRVVTRKTFNGTHRGTFLGIPPSGNRLDLTVIDIIGVKDGRLVDHLVVLDQMTLLTQLGAMPARG
jgi:steroid delta-isomerase-like uncharacterized protein